MSDDGDTAVKAVRTLGRAKVRVRPVGGASFTHGSRRKNFWHVFATEWRAEPYEMVTIVWAGNDLTGWGKATPEDLEGAVRGVA